MSSPKWHGSSIPTWAAEDDLPRRTLGFMTHLRKTTQQNYRVAMQDVLDHFVLWPIGKIEHGDVAEWVAWVSKTKGVMGDLTGAASHQSQADVGEQNGAA